MADLTYKLVLANPGYFQFTMPIGFSTTVNAYLWGGPGGNGTGAAGGGGGYAEGVLSLSAGNTVNIVVGGYGGDASGAYGGGPGAGGSVGFNGGWGANQGDPEDGDAGGSGGGGGASAILVNGGVALVAAGGGGGGGYGEDVSGGATVGLPGGVYVGHATAVYPVTLSFAWCGFMNAYAVWGGGQDYSTVINFPVTGTYTFYYSVDNYGSIYLDGSAIITRSGEHNYETYYSATASVSAGNHTVRVTGYNISGPAGVAAQIVKPDSSELWNTRYLTTTSGLINSYNGSNGTQGGAGGSGGGGGGFLGGETGAAYGDDGPGGEGGNGGLSYGAFTDPGSGTTSGGVAQKATYGAPGYVGNVGYNGYVILVFTRILGLNYKTGGAWKSVNQIYYKSTTPGTLPTVDTVPFNTVGFNTLRMALAPE